jgi:hypothetical protein
MTEKLGNPGGPRSYPADKARQGEIILRRPWQRWLFFGGLIGVGVVALFGCVWLVGGIG